MILKLNESGVVAFAKFAKESEKTCDFVDHEYQKLITHGLTRWLSLYPTWQGCFKRTQIHIHTSFPFTNQLLF